MFTSCEYYTSVCSNCGQVVNRGTERIVQDPRVSFMLPQWQKDQKSLQEYFDTTYRDQRERECPRCQASLIFEQTVKIDSPSQAIIMVCQRYARTKQGVYVKVTRHIPFGPDETLNISEHMSDTLKRRYSKITYRLQSVILHQGRLSHGHYSRMVKVDNDWFWVNDEDVKPLSHQTVTKTGSSGTSHAYIFALTLNELVPVEEDTSGAAASTVSSKIPEELALQNQAATETQTTDQPKKKTQDCGAEQVPINEPTIVPVSSEDCDPREGNAEQIEASEDCQTAEQPDNQIYNQGAEQISHETPTTSPTFSDSFALQVAAKIAQIEELNEGLLQAQNETARLRRELDAINSLSLEKIIRNLRKELGKGWSAPAASKTSQTMTIADAIARLPAADRPASISASLPRPQDTAPSSANVKNSATESMKPKLGAGAGSKRPSDTKLTDERPSQVSKTADA